MGSLLWLTRTAFYCALLSLAPLHFAHGAQGEHEPGDVRKSPSFVGIEGDFFELTFGNWSSLHFIGASAETRVINLARAPDDDQSGYLVKKSRAIHLGFGPNWPVDFGLGAAGALTNSTVGILPLIGGKALARWHIPDRDHLNDLPSLNIPRDPEDFANWSVLDRVSYQASGGIVFSVGLGYLGAAQVGVRYLAVGEWIVSIEKAGERLIRVKVTKARLHSLAETVGTAFAFLEMSRFSGLDETFLFQFSLDSPRAMEAYRHFVRGSLTQAEELSEKPGSGVAREASTSGHLKGRFRNWFLGIPELIYAYDMKGRILSTTDRAIFADGTASEIHSGAFLREKSRGGYFLNDRSTRNDFFSTLEIPDPRASLRPKYDGEYFWSFEQEESTPKHMRRAVDRLIRQTGLVDLIDVEVPKKSVGYVLFTLSLDLPQAATDRLVALAQEPKGSPLRDFSKNLLEKYFAQNDPLELCKHRFISPVESYDQCKRHFRKETDSAIGKMIRALTRLNSYQDQLHETNRKKFSLEHLKFGEAFLTNPFTFQTVLLLTQQDGTEINYRMEGERILRTHRRMAFQTKE